MPDIDVTELFEDPDFSTTFAVIRRDASVGDNGRTQVIESIYDGIVGVVSPVTNAVRRANPDMQFVSGSQQIWTRFLLRVTDDEALTDLIEWRGRRYIISNMDDWADWGAGWMHAIAMPMAPTGGSNV